MRIRCAPVTTAHDLQTCMQIRRQVFVDEQQVPLTEEQDGQDDIARHFAAWDESGIIATCRVRLLGSAAKIERVAVLKDLRNRGIGAILMRHVLQELGRLDDVRLFKLSSQAHAVPFYERLGFRAHGPEYMDAGIPHYDMVMEKETR
jgi:predicted GNAT family N-acyltransferase